MSRVRVKICGITQLEDALFACQSGADALGFVFYKKSPRYVSPEVAAEIIQCLPAFVNTVGLFVDADKAFVQQTIDTSRLDLLQFHGNEIAQYCNSFSRPYIKALRIQKKGQFEEACKEFTTARSLLVDAYKPGVPGGTGETFDWGLLPDSTVASLILAGGLTPENIRLALNQVQPYAVDVSGGVEFEKGIKDFDKIKRFIKEVRDFESV